MIKTYTYSFQVEPEIEQMLGGYLKQFEDLGFQKAQAEIDRLKAENARFREALEYIDSQYNGQAGDIAREALKGGE
jgi:hypothetical protein